ncbi:hypothetical protein ACROYT_G014122 [Oculina patagonica]
MSINPPPIPPIEIHDVPSDPRGAGRCTFASRDIKRGEVVVEYIGLKQFQSMKRRPEKPVTPGIDPYQGNGTTNQPTNMGRNDKPFEESCQLETIHLSANSDSESDSDWSMPMELVDPYIRLRKVSFILGTPLAELPPPGEQEVLPPKLKVARRCETCKCDTAGEGHKKKKDIIAKVKGQCQSCGLAVCSKHVILCCQLCKEKL